MRESQLFQGQVVHLGDRDDEPPRLPLAANLADSLAVRTFQRIGHAKDGGQLGDDHAAFPVECRIIRVCRLRRSPAVIAGHERHQPHVLPAQTENFAVVDDIKRMLVVAGVRDEQADLVQHRRDVENHLVPRLQVMIVLQCTVELPAQVGHPHRMGFVEIELSAQFDGRTDDLVDEGLVPLPAMGQLLQQAVSQIDVRHKDMIEPSGFGQHHVRQKGRSQRFRVWERQMVRLNESVNRHVQDFVGEILQRRQPELAQAIGIPFRQELRGRVAYVATQRNQCRGPPLEEAVRQLRRLSAGSGSA